MKLTNRSLFLLAALLLVAPAVLAAPTPAPAPAKSVAPAPTKPADDEDEDEPAKKPAPAPTGQQPDQPAGKTSDAKASPATSITPAPATSSGDSMVLVSGAPLNNPNVAVHTVEEKQFSDVNKRELVLYPATIQFNGRFTQHYGTMASFIWHLQENFGLMITGGYNWVNQESSLSAELQSSTSVAATAATSLLWVWGVLAGVEVAPLYGKFVIFDNALAHFSFVINGGAGAGGTRVQIRSAGQAGNVILPAEYGDTGTRFMASLGAGFRLQLGSRFTIRLEVRDVVYTAKVDSINGCTYNELKAMDANFQSPSMNVDATQTSTACQKGYFEGVDDNGQLRGRLISQAYHLMDKPSSDVLNNIGFYLGASFLF